MQDFTADDERFIEIALRSLFGARGGQLYFDTNNDLKSFVAKTALSTGVVEAWREEEPEIVGRSGDGASLGMMLVRRRQRLVYSIKPSNFLRDPMLSTSATVMAAFGVYYTEQSLPNFPLSFPGFLIGLTFTMLRSIAHPVSYGEAALLHYMNQVQEEEGYVSRAALDRAGAILVSDYDYAKGCNSNEVASLLQLLVAWRSIEKYRDGFYVRETVPFGLGPLQYID